ncbi:MAG: hypothetical protein H0X45_03520, partial [Planctomycetes bacterium]|nr:hypothetical protein [Planctomycetota bacterium]
GKTVSDIDHEMKGGQHFYDAQITVSDDQSYRLRVAEDGTLVEKH